MNSNMILKSDVLDIIFEKRNRKYGAYPLRKFYPRRLKISLVGVFITVVVFSAVTMIPDTKISNAKLVYMPPDPVYREIDETPKEPEKKKVKPKTEIKPAENATPANARRFTKNIVVVPKGVQTDSIATLLPSDVIHAKTVVTSNPGIPQVQPIADITDGSTATIPVAINKTTPLAAESVEVLPMYPGGMEALRKFLQKHLQTPEELEDNQVVSVRVKFVVDYKGKLSGFESLPGGAPAYHHEVVRVLKKMPDWIPGKTSGENVSVYYVIPVKFESTY